MENRKRPTHKTFTIYTQIQKQKKKKNHTCTMHMSSLYYCAIFFCLRLHTIILKSTPFPQEKIFPRDDFLFHSNAAVSSVLLFSFLFLYYFLFVSLMCLFLTISRSPSPILLSSTSKKEKKNGKKKMQLYVYWPDRTGRKESLDDRRHRALCDDYNDDDNDL